MTIENGNQWRASRVALNESVYPFDFHAYRHFTLVWKCALHLSPPPRGSLIKNLFGTGCNRENYDSPLFLSHDSMENLFYQRLLEINHFALTCCVTTTVCLSFVALLYRIIQFSGYYDDETSSIFILKSRHSYHSFSPSIG